MANPVSNPNKIVASNPWGGGSSYGNAAPLEKMTKETNEANKQRENEIRSMFDQLLGMYKPGGGFGAGTEAILERQKQKDLSSAVASSVSSGMFNTTLPAGFGKQWEEEIGMPSRLKLEDMRYGAYSGVLSDKIKFIQDIENMFPDYGMLAPMITQSNVIPSGNMGLNAFGERLGTSFGKGVGPKSSGIF